MLPLLGMQVQSLVGDLRSHMLCGVAKKKNQKQRGNYCTTGCRRTRALEGSHLDMVGSSTGNRVKAFKDTFKDTHGL